MQDDKIYKNLEKSTRELADLLQDIKVNPSRYVNFSIIGGSSRYVQPVKIINMQLNDYIFLFNVIFSIILLRNLRRIISNINLGRNINRNDRPFDRWKNMFRVALGQSKMTRGLLQDSSIIIYVGFVIINIEMIEIVVDGLTGSHRALSYILPLSIYNFLIASFEFLALLVLLACIIFLSEEMVQD